MLSILAAVAVAGSLSGTIPSFLLSEHQWSGYVAPGQAIEIRGVNGNVRAVEGDGPLVEVHATRYSTQSDTRRIEIAVEENANGVTVCAVYPYPARTSRRGCSAQDDAGTPVRSDVHVDFSVKVPPGVKFIARTVNGEVVAENLRSDVEAYSVNGTIRVFTSGRAQAKTVNGAIFAAVGSTKWKAAREFSTVNGEIVLDLPAEASLNVHAESRSGEIESEFPLKDFVSSDSRHLDARIGCGGPALYLKTVNGGIHLHRTI